ncbi:unnamed protein product [Toxocara canis]|uniref:Uncharacterized protein n=1 Tax=Toxocara canis TaxID=6265 RepID=A0A183VBC0_TOXCA|nr:unnamed protein product [Toxocara canis]
MCVCRLSNPKSTVDSMRFDERSPPPRPPSHHRAADSRAVDKFRRSNVTCATIYVSLCAPLIAISRNDHHEPTQTHNAPMRNYAKEFACKMGGRSSEFSHIRESRAGRLIGSPTGDEDKRARQKQTAHERKFTSGQRMEIDWPGKAALLAVDCIH